MTLQHKDITRRVTFSPNGINLATSCADRTISIWDLSMFPELKKPNEPMRLGTTAFIGLLAASAGGILFMIFVLVVRRKRRQHAFQ